MTSVSESIPPKSRACFLMIFFLSMLFSLLAYCQAFGLFVFYANVLFLCLLLLFVEDRILPFLIDQKQVWSILFQVPFNISEHHLEYSQRQDLWWLTGYCLKLIGRLQYWYLVLLKNKVYFAIWKILISCNSFFSVMAHLTYRNENKIITCTYFTL